MTTLTLQPNASAGKDTYISASGTQTWNYGVATVINVQGPASTGRGLVQFDLSSIPSGAVITSATLTLHAISVGSSAAVTVEIHRALTDWFEGNGSGSASTIAGSSWTKRDQFNSLNWGSSTAGGLSGTDYSASIAASQSVTTTGDYSWDLTSEVDAMVNGAVTNRGWWIIIASGTNKNFVSSDDGTNTTWRPKLVVVYTSDAIQGTANGTSTASGTLSTVLPYVILQPDSTDGIDTEITNVAPTANFGSRSDFHAGVSGSNGVYRGLIQFDLSSLPSNIVIHQATLSLYATAEDSTTDATVDLYRMLVQWYEGTRNGTTPGAGENASTWNFRNANGSIAWAGGAGGGVGTDFDSTATDSQSIDATGKFFNFDVTPDVISFVNGTYSNYGWMVRDATFLAGNRKYFASSDSTTASQRPKLLIVYQTNLEGSIAGVAVVSGHLIGIGGIEGTAAGVASVSAQLITNFFSVGSAAGIAAVSGTLTASGKLKGNSFGDSTATANIKANRLLFASAAGTSSHVAHLIGKFYLSGLAAGSAIFTATPSFEGQMRGSISGTSTATATGYARATNVATVIGCNPVPLLYITDGSVRPNGQLNILNFLSDRSGYLLVNYKPQIPQYKDGGYFSDSPQAQGRRLRQKVFENAIDVFEVAARAFDQDSLIQYQQDLLAFQEAASDYWTADYTQLPYYLVARAARETKIRYALIHMISCPELENPFAQPFFDHTHAAFSSLTIRIEHGIWLSTPPGGFDCVAISSQREWTVSGWQSGS